MVSRMPASTPVTVFDRVRATAFDGMKNGRPPNTVELWTEYALVAVSREPYCEFRRVGLPMHPIKWQTCTRFSRHLGESM